MSPSLQDFLDSYSSPLEALSSPVRPGPVFPYPQEHTNWRDEQRAWAQTATLFNQSWHMNDLYLSGPDAKTLLSETSVNGYETFSGGRAKQYLAVNEDGMVIGDSILFGLSDDLYAVVGAPATMNWLMFQAEQKGYDAHLELQPGRLFAGEGPVPKRLFRYELEGPNAQKILENAVGRSFDPIRFFRMGEFEISGVPVQALSHTMAAAPGAENTGLEMFGPEEHREEFLQAILQAGEEFGLVRGGSIAYGSTLAESGWIPLPVPAIYTGEGLRAYREWLPDPGFESRGVVLAGSYRPDDVECYYRSPWDLGYGHMVKFDHDFIGRDALERMADEPHGRKAWLVWDPDDAQRITAGSELGRPEQYRPLDPYRMSALHHDEIYLGDQMVGTSHVHAFTVNVGWISLGVVSESEVSEGDVVEIQWGDHDGGASNPYLPDHVRTTIRATVRWSSPGPRS